MHEGMHSHVTVCHHHSSPAEVLQVCLHVYRLIQFPHSLLTSSSPSLLSLLLSSPSLLKTPHWIMKTKDPRKSGMSNCACPVKRGGESNDNLLSTIEQKNLPPQVTRVSHDNTIHLITYIPLVSCHPSVQECHWNRIPLSHYNTSSHCWLVGHWVACLSRIH